MNAHQLDANGVVINTIIVDSLDFMPNLVEALEGTGIGWSYVNGVFINENKPIINVKDKIKSDIAELEATITPRRTREAILGIDTTWLADVEIQIGQLRQRLTEL